MEKFNLTISVKLNQDFSIENWQKNKYITLNLKCKNGIKYVMK